VSKENWPRLPRSLGQPSGSFASDIAVAAGYMPAGIAAGIAAGIVAGIANAVEEGQVDMQNTGLEDP